MDKVSNYALISNNEFLLHPDVHNKGLIRKKIILQGRN